MADEPVKYEELPEEFKKKYDEIKSVFEADLIGSFTKTRSHGIGGKGSHPMSLVNTLERVAVRVVQEIMKHQYSPSGPVLGTHQGELPFQTRPPLPFALTAPEPHGSPAFVVHKIGGDPADYQFMLEPPKEIPHRYTCIYVPDCNNLALTNQITAGGIAGATGGISGVTGGIAGGDADKQAWLAKYATAADQQSSAPAAPTVDQISAILRDQFGMVPKRRAIGYSKPYPNDMISASDQLRVRQRCGETVSEYIQRFRTMRNRCYSARLNEKEAVDLAVVGLASPIKDMASQAEYTSLAHMVQKLSLYEQRHPELYQDKFKRPVSLIEVEEDDDSAGDQEVAVAEWAQGANPVSCKWVKPQGPARGFDFDVSKAEQIFDLLLKEKQLKLPGP
ncbi:hypothetical protein QYE76_037375 [Lolium multiflorum]|uniref:Retrotransposon gag domain-containing protein n=1 Tax=Lolium multiflorum TaxID=4521 RepID=A0AAD8VF76_LOLMU|nr:hypothetical protein QYE76_037375 [Lolium multiflorum]